MRAPADILYAEVCVLWGILSSPFVMMEEESVV